jgi:WD40 repeat protein
MISRVWSSYWRPILATTATLVIVVVVWLIVRGRHDEFATLRGHRDGVYSLVLSPDGKSLASGGGDGTVRIWAVSDRRLLAVLNGHKGRVYGLAWSPDSSMIATGGDDKSIRLWNIASRKEMKAWENLSKPIRAVALSGDGTMLAAALEQEIFYWKLNGRREIKVLRGHQRIISGLAFRPEGLELVSFASDKSVRIWDLSQGRQVALLPGPVGHCFGLTLSKDGKTAACVGGGRVHLFDLESRKSLDPVEPNARIICGAAFSPDGRLLAIGSQDKDVVIWDLQKKVERSRLNGHNYAVAQLAFLPDGQTLVTSSHDSSLKLWKVR